MVRWVPLESNPEVLSKYSKTLGATKGEWIDVFALDEDSLGGIPPPVVAVILLYPISDKYDQYSKEEDEKLKESNQNIPDDVFYMKQTVGNACGTVGIIHALANNTEAIELQDGILKEFITETAGMAPLERAEALGNSEKISQAHQQTAEEGQTAAPGLDEKIKPHFVAFVHKGGSLLELDGRRAGPVNHGATTPEDLLKDAAKVCQARMQMDPEEYRFTVIAYTTAL